MAATPTHTKKTTTTRRSDRIAPGFNLPTDLSDSLNDCLFDATLAYKKCARMLRTINQFAQLAQTVVDSRVYSRIDAQSEFAQTCARTREFVHTHARAIYDADEIPDLDHEIQYDALPQDKKDQFAQQYEAVRTSREVREIIRVCDNLTPYKTSLEKETALSGSFLEEMPGISFEPFAGFDVKDAYIQDIQPKSREFILIMLHKMYTYGYRLYCEYTSPDMNVDQMINVVGDALTKLRKIPQLERCGVAFNMIERSLVLLRDNFGTYYTDFLQSHSSTTIFEHFIIDVSKQAQTKKRSASLASQFSQIIKYYRSIAQKSGQSTSRTEELFARFSEFNSQLGVEHLGRASPSASPSTSTSTSPSTGTSTSSSTSTGTSAPSPSSK